MPDNRNAEQADMGTGYRRTHCSVKAEPITLHDVDPVEGPKVGALKPRGFWYEVDADWRRWCNDEGFNLNNLHYLHAVDLADCNILKITRVAAFDQFAQMYGTDPLGINGRHEKIDWRAVANIWDGIEIAPYLWSRRLDGGIWYYGWDCASGVIWRPRGATVTFLGVLADPVTT